MISQTISKNKGPVLPSFYFFIIGQFKVSIFIREIFLINILKFNLKGNFLILEKSKKQFNVVFLRFLKVANSVFLLMNKILFLTFYIFVPNLYYKKNKKKYPPIGCHNFLFWIQYFFFKELNPLKIQENIFTMFQKYLVYLV